jgi:hypothetical protein
MGNLRSSIKILIQLLVVVGAIVLLIFSFSRFTNFQGAQTVPNALQQSYPPPSNATPTQSGYPGPQLPQASVIVSTPTLNPCLFSSPADATLVAIGLRKTPSPSQIAADATGQAKDAVVKTQISLSKTQPYPTYQSPVYPVRTEADLPGVLYNDVHMNNAIGFDACLQAKNPSPAFLVKSYDADQPDYFLLPFYKDAKVCALVMITVENGLGTVNGVGGVLGDIYPAVSSSEAVSLVEEKTGVKVVEPPVLSFRTIREALSPFSPFWEIHTTDGQSYYVIFGIGNTENGPKKYETVINTKDAHAIN